MYDVFEKNKKTIINSKALNKKMLFSNPIIV